jgi:hypothetical protein
MDTWEALSGCGERHEKGVDEPQEGERTSRGELGGMGMMGGWIYVEAHLSIREKLGYTIGCPLGAC